jgi:hypothetical protein
MVEFTIARAKDSFGGGSIVANLNMHDQFNLYNIGHSELTVGSQGILFRSMFNFIQTDIGHCA